MKNCSKIGLFKSKGRLYKEPPNNYRNPFQRDRDRIIHSASFRRLKHKTQVFVNTDGDHYRTRITHSLEVAQIARSITRYLNLNDDLVIFFGLFIGSQISTNPYSSDRLLKCFKIFLFFKTLGGLKIFWNTLSTACKTVLLDL